MSLERIPPSVVHPESGLPIGPEVPGGPARRPQCVLLEGRLVRLEPLDPVAHGAALFRHSHGPEKERLFLYRGQSPASGMVDYAAWLRGAAASEDPLCFAICLREGGEAVGHATYMRIVPEDRVIEVGNILFTPALARRAEATEAMYLMARYVFEDLGYRRYEWKCNALHEGSRRAAERLGFRYEGTFRNHMIVKGRSRDTAWFAMLDEDWPAVKAEFERWLAPENFDAGGRQKTQLEMRAAGGGEGW